MKFKTIYLLTFLLPLVATAQEFAPIGATWHYEDEDGIFPYQGRHYKLEAISDTIINTKPCRKIQIIHYNSNIDTLQPEYLYADSNRIYFYRYNKFNLLFDFNAQIGDTIPVTDPAFSPSNPDTISHMIVDSIHYIFEENIYIFTGNDSLKVFYTHPANLGTDLQFKQPVIENIGSVYWMFPLPAFTPSGENRLLRCYQDTATYYQAYTIGTCDYWVTGIAENQNSQSQATIYPNPFTQTATITLQGIQLPATLTIYDNLGRAVRKETITTPQHTIQRNNLSNGIYLYHINGQSGKLVITGQKP